MKTTFKIVFYTTWLGWFPYLWLVAFGWNSASHIRAIIFCIGFIICAGGLLTSMFFVGNKAFWMSLEELEDYKEKHRESIKAYNEAKDKLITKLTE